MSNLIINHKIMVETSSIISSFIYINKELERGTIGKTKAIALKLANILGTNPFINYRTIQNGNQYGLINIARVVKGSQYALLWNKAKVVLGNQVVSQFLVGIGVNMAKKVKKNQIIGGLAGGVGVNLADTVVESQGIGVGGAVGVGYNISEEYVKNQEIIGFLGGMGLNLADTVWEQQNIYGIIGLGVGYNAATQVDKQDVYGGLAGWGINSVEGSDAEKSND